MTTAIIITLCLLLLLAYLFDISSARTRIPSVILLLLVGWGMKQLALFLSIEIPSMEPVLPILGTVGLILIVLEGSLELDIDATKFSTIGKAFVGAGASAFILSMVIAFAVHYIGGYALKDSLTNAIPLAIISSAIAIPTARNLSAVNREFVVYESSISDILGVLFFNFIALNEIFNGLTFIQFGGELILMAVVSLASTLGLSFLLHRVQHPVKFIPIMLLVVLIYALAKLYHLPSLLFILVLGLFLGNVNEIKKFSWTRKFPLEELSLQVDRLHELTTEIAFLIRSLFFLAFGYSLEAYEILNTATIPWSVGIVVLIYLVRAAQLRLSGLPLSPLLFIAPRGLITILLFISISPEDVIPLVNRSLLTQVILMTALVMMVGMIASPPALPPASPPAPLRKTERGESL